MKKTIYISITDDDRRLIIDGDFGLLVDYLRIMMPPQSITDGGPVRIEYIEPDRPEFIDIEQAALFLGVTTSRIRQLARTNELRGVKIGKRAWAFERGDLEAFAGKPRPVGRPPSVLT